MAIRTTATTVKNSSYSKPSTPKKPSTASVSSSASRTTTLKQTKPTSSTPKRDTFTYSSPTVKQTVPKTTAKTTSASKNTATKASTAKTNATSSQTTASKAVSTAKTTASAKSTQTNKSASAVKTSTTAKTSNTKTSSAAKSTATVSNTKRDTFTYSSEAVKNAVKSATASKSAANSKSTVQNNAKSSQTKTAVKSNSSNKSAASGTVSKSKTDSSKKAMLESMQKAYEHTKDPKQREAMRKTMNDIAYELSSKKTSRNSDNAAKKLEELGIDLTTLTFMPDGSKYGSRIIENGQSYEIVPEGDARLHQYGYITERDYDNILYIVAHEVGSENINSTEKFATASALLNQLEQYWGNGDTIEDSLNNFYKYNSCRDDGGVIDISHEQCIYSRAEETNALKLNVKSEVDLALQGVRAFDEDIQSWLALGDNLHGKYGTNLDVGGIYVTSEKSVYSNR